MPRPSLKTLALIPLAALAGLIAVPPPAQSFNFGNMMSPGRWMGGGDGYYDDYYNDGPWGGYGGGPWGGLYGVPGYGYPGPGYGVPGYLGAPPVPTPPAVHRNGAADQAEIESLKRRIEELESAQRAGAATAPTDWPAAPAFRPMNRN